MDMVRRSLFELDNLRFMSLTLRAQFSLSLQFIPPFCFGYNYADYVSYRSFFLLDIVDPAEQQDSIRSQQNFTTGTEL